jgi:hypothetical protein
MPPVAVAKLRQVRNFEEVGERPDFGPLDYGCIVYGEPSLTHMDGPYLYDSDSSLDFTFVTQNATGIPNSKWSLEIPEAGIATVQALSIEQWWPVVSATHSSTDLARRRPLLMHDGVPYTWINPGEEVWINGGVVGGDGHGSIMMGLYRLIDPDVPPIQVGTKSFTWTANTPIPAMIDWVYSGWYAVKAEVLSVTSGILASVAIGMNINCKDGFAYWKLHYAPEIVSTPVIAHDCRRTACGLLLSNRSNELLAQGNIVAARLAANFPGGQTTAIWKDVSSASDVYSQKALKGCYTYTEFDFYDEEFRGHVNAYGQPICFWPKGMMNVIVVNNTSNNPNTWVTCCDINLEFKTSSQLFPKAVSVLSNAELIEARRINNMTTYFYENPLHWDDIAKYISAMWSWTRKHSTAIGTAASLVAPEAAPLIMGMARLMQN